MGRFPLVDKEIVSEEKNKPVLDEQTLAKLLEAAYVLQEHNRELQEMELGLELKRDQIEAAERSSPAPDAPKNHETEPVAHADYTFTLAKIVETQHQIQVRHLELESAMSLVAERLVQIARASGAAIGILEGKNRRDPTPDSGSSSRTRKRNVVGRRTPGSDCASQRRCDWHTRGQKSSRPNTRFRFVISN